MSDDRYYYAARAEEERRLAMTAAHLAARKAHLELAARYGALCERKIGSAGEPTEHRKKTA